jgi:copper resistance protein B
MRFFWRLVAFSFTGLALGLAGPADGYAQMPAGPMQMGPVPVGQTDPKAKQQLVSDVQGGEHERAPVYSLVRLNNLDFGGSSAGQRTFWDFNARVGTDENRVSLKSEGTAIRGRTRDADVQLLYDRPISDFFDFQVGVRHVLEPANRTYFAVGVEGVAQYFFDTEATLFVSEKGQVSARVKGGLDIAITRTIYTKPALELDLYAANDRRTDQYTGGLSRLSLQTRYEVTRQFTPYVEVGWERIFGQNGAQARRRGEGIDNLYAVVGLRLWY